MADQREIEPNNNKEREIPVFTVLKNSVILKNIFLINDRLSPSEIANGKCTKTYEDYEETLVVGRHPDCDIRLEHPSISRFHLRIHSKPSSKLLTVTDLSSVHGTWILGMKIEPNIRKEVNEGDTLSIGLSSRVYMLHWVPLSKAYDVENPFVPPLNMPAAEKQKGKDVIIKDENDTALENEDVQNNDGLETKEISLGSSILDGQNFAIFDVDNELKEQVAANKDKEPVVTEIFGSLYVDEYNECSPQEEVSSAYPMPDDRNVKCQVEKPVTVTEHILSVDSAVVDNLKSLCLVENTELRVYKVNPSTPPSEDANVKLEVEEPLTGTEDIHSVDSEALDGFKSVCLVEKTELDLYEVDPSAPPLSGDSNVKLQVEEPVTVTEDKRSVDSAAANGFKSACLVENTELPAHEVNPSAPPPLEDWKVKLEVEEAIAGIDEIHSLNSAVVDGSGPLCLVENIELTADEVNPSAPPSGDRNVKHQSEEPVTVNEDNHLVDTAVVEGFESLCLVENIELPAEEVNPFAPPPSEDRNVKLEVEEPFSGIEDIHSVDSAVVERFVSSCLVENIEWPVVELNPSAPPPSGDGNVKVQFEEPVTVTEINHSLDSTEVDGFESLCLVDNTELPAHYVNPSAPPMSEDMNFVVPEVQKRKKEHEEVEMWNGALSESKSLKDPDINTNQGCLNTACEQNALWSFWSGNMGLESIYSSFSDWEQFSELENRMSNNENQNPKHLSHWINLFETSSLESRPTSSGQKSNLSSSIWSRRVDTENNHQIQTSRCKVRKLDTNIVANEETQNGDLSMPRVLFQGVDCQKGKYYTPDKENYASKTQASMRTSSPSIYRLNNGLSPSAGKENQTLKDKKNEESGLLISEILKKYIKQTKKGEERIPIQLLHTNSPQKTASETVLSNATMNCSRAKSKLHPDSSRKRAQRWNMVIDTTCLLNKESLKALQLLEGIKGTRLIVPRIVIRELDSMKRQVSLFIRRTEVLAALEWIDECMARTNWWIHIQNSAEEGRPLDSTPPGTPQCLYSCSFFTGALFSALSAQSDIKSPTAEDHIVEYALSLRKTENSEQLIFLTDDVTRKIKAMEKALICETAEEFRNSLVNPFSERFLWSYSAPRGQTWTCFDDVLLRENFYPCSTGTTSKANSMKGLKLILLHNPSMHGSAQSVRIPHHQIV